METVRSRLSSSAILVKTASVVEKGMSFSWDCEVVYCRLQVGLKEIEIELSRNFEWSWDGRLTETYVESGSVADLMGT
jgi:hypothetical protein